MKREEFVQKVGWVYEDSPWVAERTWRADLPGSGEALAECLQRAVEAASRDEQLALLRAHPDLGTRAQVSQSSANEQAGAGLSSLTQQEHARLLELNAAYKDKFGFPFLYAVKGSTKFDILGALERRLGGTADEEFETALQQVYRIARFRLESVI